MTHRPAASAPARHQPLDASMSLLTHLLTNSLDEGYTEAAQRRQAAGDPAGTRPTGVLVVVGLLVIGLVLALGAVVTRTHEPARLAQRNQLIDQIEARNKTADQVARQISVLTAELDRIRARALALTGAGQAAAQQLAWLSEQVGLTALRGPGVDVVVEDAPPPAEGEDLDPPDPGEVDPGTVQDVDLQRVANGLFAAGAEAVAINGQRLTALTAIREAGGAILVNYRTTTSPYHVRAIGPPAQLQSRFAQSEDGRYLHSVKENWGVRYQVRAIEDMTLPGAPAVSVREATTLPEEPKGGSR